MRVMKRCEIAVIGLTLALSGTGLARDGGDDPFTAVAITSVPFSDEGSNRANSSAFDYACPGVPAEFDGRDQWYAVVATQSMTVRITTCSPVTDYDTKLYVFRDSVAWDAVVACDDDSCDSLAQPYLAEIESVSLEAGHTYFIVVDAYSQSDEGRFRLTVESLGVVEPVCPGDVNGSQLVDVDDLNEVLSAWQMSMPAGVGPELTGDGVVDVDDLNEVLSNWQTVCKDAAG